MARKSSTITAAVLACLLGACVGPVGTAPAAAPAAKAQADIPADASREIRTWTLKKGDSIEARLLETKGNTNVLQKADGTKRKIHRSGLSEADLEYIQTVRDAPPPAEDAEEAAESAEAGAEKAGQQETAENDEQAEPAKKKKLPDGLVLWLDAADTKTVTVDAAGPGAAEGVTLPAGAEGWVAQWADKSGKGSNAVQPAAAGRPAYVPKAFGDLPMLHFENGWQRLNTDCIPATGKNPRTIIVAVANLKQIEKALLCHILHYGSPENEKSYGITYRGWQSVNWGNHYHHGALNSGIPTSSGGGYIVVAMFDNGADHFTVNGGATYQEGRPWPQGAIDTAGGGQKVGMVIGAGLGGGEGTCGDIGEVMAFSRAVPPQERMGIEGYLAHKWGMADLLPAGHPFKRSPPPWAKDLMPPGHSTDKEKAD